MRKEIIKDIAIILLLALIILPIFSMIIDKSDFVNSTNETSIYAPQFTPKINKKASYKPKKASYKPSNNSIRDVNDLLSTNTIPSGSGITAGTKTGFAQSSFHTQANHYNPSQSQYENKYKVGHVSAPIWAKEKVSTVKKTNEKQAYQSSYASNWSSIRAPFSNTTSDGTIIVGPSTDPSEENRIPIGSGHYVLLICAGGYTLYKFRC